jgi:hypothetical protein
MMRFFTLASVLPGLVALSLAAAPPLATGPVRRDLYAILVFDTDAENIGLSVKVDQKNVLNALKDAYRGQEMPGKLFLKVFTGEDARKKIIREYIAGLKGKVKRTDTVFFYYCGHGGESKHNNQRLAFSHDGTTGPFRWYFEEEINRLEPRLKIIIHDCCANGPQPRATAKPSEGIRPRGDAGQVNPRLFRQLFFEGSDWVIIGGAKRQDYSYSDSELGGMFTWSFVDSLSKEPSEFNGGKDGKVTWKSFFARVKERTTRMCNRQTPEAHYLNEPRCREHHLQFVNRTGEAVAVRFRYLNGSEIDQIYRPKLARGWLTCAIPANGELIATDRGNKVRAFAYQYVAVGKKSGKKWIFSRDPKLADQDQTNAIAIDMGMAYNAGRDGKAVHTERVLIQK